MIATKKEKLNPKIEKNNLKILEYKEKIKVLEAENIKYRNEIKKEEEQKILNLLETKNIDISQLEILINGLNNTNIDNEISNNDKNNSDERRYSFE